MSSGKRGPNWPKKLAVPVEVVQPLPSYQFWVGYPRSQDLNQENFMQAAAKGRTRVTKKIVWKSQDQKLCVVPGPFPEGLFRSDTRHTVKGAAKLTPSDMWVHPDGTEKEDRYALMLTADVDEVLSGENEFGEVSP